MNKGIGKTALALGLGLAGLVSTSCKEFDGEKVLSKGTINGNQVRVIQEEFDWGYDNYRLEMYDPNGELMVISRGNDWQNLILFYDDGTRYLGSPPKR